MKGTLIQPALPKRWLNYLPSSSIALGAILLLQLIPSAPSQAGTPSFRLNLRLEEGRGRLDWNSVSGAVYRVQSTPALTSPSNQWRTVAAVLARGPQTTWRDPEKPLGNRFYRMLSPDVE